jgi:hypothetical protein
MSFVHPHGSRAPAVVDTTYKRNVGVDAAATPSAGVRRHETDANARANASASAEREQGIFFTGLLA